MAKPTLPPAGGDRILPGSISNDTEDSIGSGEEAGQTQKLGPDTNQPTPPVVPEKKIYEMKLEPQEYERPKTADIDWMRVWMEESTSGQGSIGGYEPPETFLNSKTRQMFEKIVGLGGTMELRKPSTTGKGNWVTFMITTTPEPWLTEEELEMHPLGGLRKQFSPLAAEFVEDAIRDLTKSPHAFVGYNPYKEVDLDGYGKILIQLTKDKQFSPHRILPPHSKANRPTRELRTEVHVKSHVRTGPALLMAFATQEDFSPMAKPVVVT